MKKIFRPLFAVMAIALVASCSEQIGNEATSEPGNLIKMTFSASMGGDVEDTKTTYSGCKVYWEATDAITVFSVGESVTKTSFAEPELLENNAVARFSGVADASAETYYAVYPHSEANEYANESIKVKFPDTHTAVANGFPSGSNVSVAVSIKDAEVTEQNLQFKNVGALLAFSFNTADDAAKTKSVTFKARKSEDGAETPEFWGLTGDVTVSIDEDGLPVASEGSVDHVTVTAPEGGFATGTNYLIPVCPVGDCTGMQVIFTDQEDNTYIKNNDVDFQLLRSYMFNVGKVLYPYDTLQKNFTITWDFANVEWPFNGVCKYVSSDGEYYTYSYPYEYNGEKKWVDWSIRMGYQPYELTNSGLSATVAENKSFIMSLPAVEGRYLTKITVQVSSDSKQPRIGVQSRWANSAVGEYCVLASKYLKKGTECVIDFYQDAIWFNGKFMSNSTSTSQSATVYKYLVSEYPRFIPEQGKQYYLKLRDTGIVSQITLTYSITAPGNAPTTAAE